MQIYKTSQKILIAGAIFAMCAVMIGAFAAHGLKQVLDDHALGLIETAAKYQMYHAIALLLLGVMSSLAQFPVKLLNWAAFFFTFGILLFSGSLYLLAVSNVKWLGAVVPLGGVAFILGWLMLIISIHKSAISTKP
jgi:uncharacterized membrane protein YgdD (TMEM256/DUF423 family)